MQFTLPVFERRQSGIFELRTLGLGPASQMRVGRYHHKVRTALAGDLRAVIEKLKAHELERFQLPRGIKLERVRLELTLAGGGDKRKVTGIYPVVIEPHWASEDERVYLAYHPERQHESLPVRIDLPLEDQLRPYFSKAWSGLDGDELGGLWSRGKERIDVLSFSGDTRSLLEDLPQKKRDARDQLGADPARRGKKRRRLQALPKLGMNLTDRAAGGDLDVGMPRSPHREQLQLLLGSNRGQPVIVVGPPGSGKTTLIHRAVADMLEADGYAAHRNRDRVRDAWALSGRRIIAGMSHLGDWEKRCVEVLEDARSRDLVLIVDDVHHFGRIGRSRESDRSLADFFRGPLSRREIVIVGECTPEELRSLEQDAPAFASLFTPLHLPPATPAETLRLMVRLMRSLETSSHLEVSPYALRTVLELSGSLLSGQAFPGKALDLLRDLGRSRQGTAEEARVLSSRDVFEWLSAKTGVPEILLQREKKLDPAEVTETFARRVVGQDEAVKVAVDLVTRIKTGLTDPRRPYGVYLFTGPTGTGKTELAKALAEYLYGSDARLLRFDMSELSGPDAPARLIGHRWSPEGLLTRKVQEQPFSLVLLDEIEKAHPSVHSLLLQLFEDGRLTDASGKTAHFNHTVVVMTSNLGARSRAAVGFGEAAEAVLQDIARAVREFFAPELFNRIDRIVPFRPLTAEVAERVAAKELDKLCRRRGLVERSIFVQPEAGVTERIAQVAFVAADGARSVKRYLEDSIGALMTEAIAGERAAAMQILRIHTAAEGFGLTREALDEHAPLDVKWALEPLLAEPLGALRARLPALLSFVEELEHGDAITRLSERIRFHLGRQGEVDHAEAIYNLDAMRAAVHAFGDKIRELGRADAEDERHDDIEMMAFRYERRADDWIGTEVRYRLFHPQQMPPRARQPLKAEVLSAIAEGYALRRALRRVDDPDEHAVFVEILRAGHVAPEGAPTGLGGLVESLARAYSTARGELEGWVGRFGANSLSDGYGVEDLDRFCDAWMDESPDPVHHVVLKIVGLCVRDFFSLEEGVHVWTSLSHEPQIARVRVHPAAAGETPALFIERFLAARKAYDDAKRAGTEAPPDPAALLPVVRKIRFDLPRVPGATSPMEIEDYVMGYAETVHVPNVMAGFAPLWLLRLGREDDAEGGPAT